MENKNTVLTKSVENIQLLPCATNISQWTAEIARSQVDLVKPCFQAMHNVTMLLSPVIAEIEEKGGAKLLGYKNMDELASNEWGISHGTLSNARKIFQRFGEKDNDGRNILSDSWSEYGARKLLLLTTASQSVINNASPDMTFEEIKAMMSPQTVTVEEKTTEGIENGENINIDEKDENTTENTEGGENVNTDNSEEKATETETEEKAPEYTLLGVSTTVITVIENLATDKLTKTDKKQIEELRALLHKVLESVENGLS